MRYISLFSGIEAATVAWHSLGWECAAVAEIEPFPCAVLAHHYPTVPNLGDVTQITEERIAALGPLDLVVFGSPCQDLSVAGKRAGLSGERSGLFFTAVKIVEWARKHNGARYTLWENVPGAFSSSRGADFAIVVGELAGATGIAVPPKGWGTEGALVGEKGMVEWSTLDAQWFGVAQRRRRVFAFADFGDWAGRQPVLLEPEGLRGDFAPRREAGQDIAGTISARSKGGGGLGTDFDLAGGLQRSGVASTGEIAHCLNAGSMGRIDYETETFVTCTGVMPTMRAGAPGNNAGHGARSGGNKDEYIVPVLGFNHNAQVDQMNFDPHSVLGLTCSQGAAVMTLAIRGRGDSHDLETRSDGTANAILTPNGGRGGIGCGAVHTGMQVRRLTPRECERLQGFKDDYTLVPYRGKAAADGPRYKALGNSMCAKVMLWIGKQIDLIEVFQ